MTLDDLQHEQTIPAVLVNQEGFITYINTPFEQTFGYKKAEIIGQLLSIIIPKNLRDAHHLGFSRFLMTGQPTLLGKPLNLKAVTKDGTIFDAEHIIIAEQQHGQWVFGATIRPL